MLKNVELLNTRYTKRNMTPKQFEKFAVSQVLESHDDIAWFRTAEDAHKAMESFKYQFSDYRVVQDGLYQYNSNGQVVSIQRLYYIAGQYGTITRGKFGLK